MNNIPVPKPPPPPPAPRPASPAAPRRQTRRGFFESISDQEKIDFARHLAIIIKAGIPLYDGLIIVKRQSQSAKLINIVDQLSRDVSNGLFFADSLDRYHDLFGDFFISVVRVGEASGTLAQNLLYLSTETKKRRDLKRKIKSAMVYPTVILVATLAVTAFLAFFVFPKLLPALTGSGGTLPASTRLLITLIGFVTSYGIVSAIGVAILVVIFNYTLHHVEAFRYLLHRLILVTPVLSRLSVDLNMINFSRILSLLLKSGVKIAEALTITGKTFDNLVYRRLVEEASAEIGRGGALAPFLEQRSKLFPPFITGMIQIGEATGNLNENLQYVGEYYEEEVSYSLDSLTTIIEPIMLLLMGLMVGFVAISIITPIYSISSNLAQ
jgi:type IV pilus assembly protein PilC